MQLSRNNKNSRYALLLISRRYTVSDELKYVEICWQNYLKDFDQLIPAVKIKVEDVECNLDILYPRTLKHYNSVITEESIHTTDGNITGEKTKDIFDETESSLMITEDNQTGNSMLKHLGYKIRLKHQLLMTHINTFYYIHA